MYENLTHYNAEPQKCNKPVYMKIIFKCEYVSTTIVESYTRKYHEFVAV